MDTFKKVFSEEITNWLAKSDQKVTDYILDHNELRKIDFRWIYSRMLPLWLS